LRQAQFGVFGLLALFLLYASGSAVAAKPQQGRFRVTVTATLTKTWTVSRTEGEPGCVRTTRSTGRWQASLSTKAASTIRVVAAGRGRVRFSGTVSALKGSGAQSGTNSVIGQGSPPCDRQTRTVKCGEQRGAFSRGSSTLSNPRKGVLQLGRLKGADRLRSFSPQCPEEPSEVRSIRTDLPLATGPLDASDFFRRDVPRFFVTGDTEQETTITGDLEGTVVERVRWKATFTRLR
jgi:hypothetical protein